MFWLLDLLELSYRTNTQHGNIIEYFSQISALNNSNTNYMT